VADTDIGGAVESDLSGVMVDYSVDPEETDGAGGEKEFSYQNPFWNEDYGYYLNIPEFKVAVDTKAVWTIGAGFTADEPTELLLMTIKGNGKDSFNSILKNMIKVKTFAQDSFAEVIRDDDGVLANLKPLNSGGMKIVQNAQGRIIRYEQVSRNKKVVKKFKPDEIFHLSHDRIADEIHGTRIINSLKWLILARNEAMSDNKIALHRNIVPVNLFYLDTDDTTEIAAFKTKMDNAYKNGENVYVPKGTVERDTGGVPPNSTLNPIHWVDKLNDYFFQAVNVPQIIIGNAKEFTDASGKIVYLSYEQSVKAEQLYIEEQVLGQLNLEIQLTFPASLQNELISSRESDSNMQASQPNDTTEELEGRQ